jgi:GNAT superfamily N-acetyltransferase
VTEVVTGERADLEEVLTDRLVEFNVAASEVVRERFEPENLRSHRLAAWALDGDRLLGGCVGRSEDVWHWLTVDTMWVDPALRGTGIGRALLTSVEDQARARGCRWAKVNTWDFQAPLFYAACGYDVYAREVDYPPGHVNHLMRKDLRAK